MVELVPVGYIAKIVPEAGCDEVILRHLPLKIVLLLIVKLPSIRYVPAGTKTVPPPLAAATSSAS